MEIHFLGCTSLAFKTGNKQKRTSPLHLVLVKLGWIPPVITQRFDAAITPSSARQVEDGVTARLYQPPTEAHPVRSERELTGGMGCTPTAKRAVIAASVGAAASATLIP